MWDALATLLGLLFIGYVLKIIIGRVYKPTKKFPPH